MSAADTDYLIDIARAAAEAPHGSKGPIYQAATQHLKISLAELHRRLNTVTVRKQRKQRTDAGTSAMDYAEAFLLSGYIHEHIRRNGKRIKSVVQAVDELRANNAITAARLDPKTGELKRLSTSAILRALSAYSLHPSQVAQPDPVTPLQSPHPNWCWQIDASLCVIFKMPVKNGTRIEELRGQDAYKNKLQHLAKIEHLLVQRYLITDHASGVLRPFFALGGESTEGLVSCLINSFVRRKNFPMHGAPNILMLDQASANRSAMIRNLCRSLTIELSYTMPGNPRSKGQVEGAHNIFEMGFESGLKLAPEISTISQLQELADQWADYFNGSKIHSRHGMTRYECWQTIKQTELRPVDLDDKSLRILARSEPKTPKVSPNLTVDFLGQDYDVSKIPEVLVGQKLPVCRCGYDAESALVVRIDENGHEQFHIIPKKQRNELGFFNDAAILGREFKRHEETPVQTAKKQMELVATGAETLEDAKKRRKSNVIAFAGAINPYKQAQEYTPPAWIPKQGVAIDVPRPSVEVPKLTFTDLIVRLAAEMGRAWSPDYTPIVRTWHPEGAADELIPGIIDRLKNGDPAHATPKLRSVK